MKRNKKSDEIMEVLADAGRPQDSAGNTRLTLLADKIKSLPPANKAWRSYVDGIRGLSKTLDKLSRKKIQRLYKLINLAELPYLEYSFIFSRAFKQWSRKSWNVARRAEIFRLIGESGMFVDLDFIQREKGIKKNFPWHWIDVAVRVDWKLAKGVINEQLKKENDLEPVMRRLPRWLDLHKSKRSLRRTLADILKGVKIKTADRDLLESLFAAL